MTELQSSRLQLRQWRETDLLPWAMMNGDAQVREHLGGPIGRAESDASVEHFRRGIDHNGYGWWAIELRATGIFIGLAGLDELGPDMPIEGFESGWQIARDKWGRGYATEAAWLVLKYGFEQLNLPEIVAITSRANMRSQAVLHKLGMSMDTAMFRASEATSSNTRDIDVIFRKQPPRGNQIYSD